MQGPFSSPSFLDLQRTRDPSWLFIALFVIACHLFALWLGLAWPAKSPRQEVRSRVVVKTVQLTPSLQPVSIAAAQQAPAPIPPPPLEAKKDAELGKELSLETPPFAPLIPLPSEEPPLPPAPDPIPNPAPDPAPAPEPVSEPVPLSERAPPENKEIKPQEAPPPAPKAEEKKQKQNPPAAKKIAKPAPKEAPAEPKKPAAAKKPAANPAPVKKPAAEQEAKKPSKAEANKKAEASKSARAEEAEKKRQQEIAAAQEAARQRERELLNKAKEKFAKIGETRNKINAGSSVKLEETSIPKPIESLQIDALPVGEASSAALSAQAISYRDEIALRLKSGLRLPDYGAVKIKLTLNKTGKVQQVAIVSSESQKNKQYIERTLPTLPFPPFGNQFEGASQYTFMITLNNDH